ncbi:ATP-dependent helicase [bacterium]|nr:ATP-dependent helicase [bacterium]
MAKLFYIELIYFFLLSEERPGEAGGPFMTSCDHISFELDVKAARAAWRRAKASGVRACWLACSKLAPDRLFNHEKFDQVFIYQDLALPAFLNVLTILQSQIISPLLQAAKPFSFLSRWPRSFYTARLNSDGLHDSRQQLSAQILLEHFGPMLDRSFQLQRTPLQKKSTALALDEDLDEAQVNAIRQLYGPVRVLAPAGSGKTKTLINRIIHLVNEGVAAHRILALAFNKKAAQEMVERLAQRGVAIAGNLDEEGVTVRTFHALGYEILRRHNGWRYQHDEGDKRCRQLLQTAAEKVLRLPMLRNQDPAAGLLASLTAATTDLPEWEEMRTEINGEQFPFKDIFAHYLQLQSAQGYMNFDDMIYWPLRLLLDDAGLRQTIQHRFHFVLVDEFQDLNRSQLLLMQLLSMPHNNLFVVGDDDQMIYGWRGADVQNILNFAEHYRGAATYTLETNYRSTRQVIDHSKWLIAHNRRRVAKDIHPTATAAEGEFTVTLHSNLWAQAKKAVEWILQRREQGADGWSDFAVLYRYHVYQYLLAVLLDSYKIPHTFVDHRGLMQTAVGRDVYSYLTVLFFPQAAGEKEWSRVLKRPNKFLTNSLIRTITSWEALEQVACDLTVSERERLVLEEWLRQVDPFRRIDANAVKVPDLLARLVTSFDLRSFYAGLPSVYGAADEAGQEVVLDVLIEVSAACADLTEFYQQLSPAGPGDPADEWEAEASVPQVTLATIHASKGKEFPHVVLFHLAHDYRLRSDPDWEEERRVTYVGVTRAIRTLLITAPEKEYSDFLIEVSLNPGLAGLSDAKLEKKIHELKKERRPLPMPKNAGADVEPATTSRQKLAELEQELALRRLLIHGERNA